MQFWVSSESKLSDSWQPRSLDIEVAAYALLSHFLQFQASEGIPIMRWLSRQRNSLGGFASTQVRDDSFFPLNYNIYNIYFLLGVFYISNKI